MIKYSISEKIPIIPNAINKQTHISNRKTPHNLKKHRGISISESKLILFSSLFHS